MQKKKENKVLLIGISDLTDLKNFFVKKKFKICELDFKKKKGVKYLNLLNSNDCLQYAKKQKISAVITDQNDFAFESYSKIVDCLNLNGIPSNVSSYFIDKLKFRIKTKKNKKLKSNIPLFYNFKTLEELKKYNLPKKRFIIKPVRSQGSRDQFVSSKKNKIIHFINKNKFDIKNFIIEEYINGKNYSLEGYVQNNELYLLGVSEKIKFINSTVDKRLIYSPYQFKVKKKLYDISQKIIRNLNLRKGLYHAEFKIFKSKIYIIEAACRGAGSGVTNKILKLTANFNYKNFLLSLALNTTYNFTEKKISKNYFLLGWYSNFKFKKINKIIIPSIKNIKFLKSLKLKKNYKNKNLYSIKNSTDRVLSYIIEGKSKKDLMNKEKFLLKKISVSYL